MEVDGLPSTVMLPLAVILTFDFSTQKYNQRIYELKHTCD